MRWLTSAFTLSALIAGAGCHDQVYPTAPTPPSQAPSLSMGRAGAPPVVDPSGRTFNLSPRGGTYRIGDYLLTLPPHSVCDPETSSYGAGHWDEPCDAATRPIRVSASVTTIDGRDYVDFAPRLRFVPSDAPGRWVTIRTFRRAAIGATGDLRRFSILFSEIPGGPVVDESQRDGTLATHVNVRTGLVWRRIEHFTGYNVFTGLVDDCTPGVDAGCYTIGTVIRDGTNPAR